ncbi:MAG: hypothetical protein FWC26_06690 [Fibromonadales bacterium]|nr:hypothetical protein [Fibromonadales bacterium]
MFYRKILKIFESCESGFRLWKKLAWLPLAVITLFHTIGCGPEYVYDYTSYDVYAGGIVSDSTAILLEIVVDHYSEERIFGMGIDGGGDSKLREINLKLVDIRIEKVYWSKDIINILSTSNYGPLRFDAIDSVLLFYSATGVFKEESSYRIGRIAVVHMDEKFRQAEKMTLENKEIALKGKGWEERMNERVRPWRDGLMLAYRAGVTNPYALLDTAAGTMELWQPTGEFEWLNECVDAKWSEIGGLCLKNMPDVPGFVLLKNGIDTLAVGHRGTSPYFNGNSIVSSTFVYLISKQGLVLEEPLDVRFYGTGNFYDLYGNLLVDYGKK